MNNKAAQAYFQTKVSTTDQGQLLLLLYDGALNFLQQAREKMLEKDYAAKGILISKVIDIVSELANTLNLEKGGNLAENLNNLYFLCTTRLLQANLKMNVEQLDSVTTILSGLRSAYAQIINTPEAQKVAAQIATKINSAGSMTQRGALITNVATAPAAIGQVQARMAYGQQSAQSMMPAAAAPAVSAGAAVTAAPVASVAPVQQAVAQTVVSQAPQVQTVAPTPPMQKPVTPQGFAPAAAPSAMAAAPSAPSAPSAPLAQPAPAATAAAPSAPAQSAPAATAAAPSAPSAPLAQSAPVATAAAPSAPSAQPAPAATAPSAPPPVAAPVTSPSAASAPALGTGLAQGFAAPQLNRKLASYAKMG